MVHEICKDQLLSQQGLEIPLSLTPKAQFLLVSVRELKVQDGKSRMDLNFHKTSADFQLM